MRWRPAAPSLAVAGLALLASLPALANGFTLDDVPLVVDNPRVHQLLSPLAYLRQTYWPPEITASLYRPATVFGFALQWAVGGGAPWVFHLVSALVYAALAVAMLRLAEHLLPPRGALVAAACFAVHPVHVEAVAGVVGQSELVVALCTVLAAVRYLEARQRPAIGPADVGIITGLFLLGAFAKEQGLMLPVMLVALEATVVKDSRPVGERIRSLWPLFRVLAVAGLAYLAARSTVVGGLAGDSANVALRDLGIAGRALTMLAIIPIWNRLLFAPWHLQADYMPREVPTIPELGVAPVVGVAILAAFGVGLWRARGRGPAPRLSMAWMGIALFPVSNLVVPTGILVAERTLLLPSVGAMLLVGAFAAAWERHGSLVLAGAGLLMVAWAGRTLTRIPVWHDNDRLLAQTLIDAPASYKVRWDHARALDRSGDVAGAEREFAAALELYARDPALLAEIGDRRRAEDRCAEAIPLYRRALALDPGRWVTRTRLILCSARAGDLAGARAQLAELERRKEGDAARIRESLAAPDTQPAAAVGEPR